jgi:hypothetical protein
LRKLQANSDQCESIRAAEGSRWPPLTGEGIWRTEEILLHTGLNIFQWKTMGIDSHRPKPIMIKKIELEGANRMYMCQLNVMMNRMESNLCICSLKRLIGVGYTSSCNPCPSGFYSDKSASKTCTPCPANTFSSHQSTRCTACDTDNYYSEPGSKECILRPACTVADYFQIHKPCKNNKVLISLFYE